MNYLTDGETLYEVHAEYQADNHGLAGGTLDVTLVRPANPAKWEPRILACGKGARHCTRGLTSTDWHRMGWANRQLCREVRA